MIPTPITAATYWHRSLNPKKLIETGFSSLPNNTPMARYLKIHKLPAEPSIVGMKPMEKKHVPIVHKKLNEYLKQFKLHLHFTEGEIEHFLLPREWVVESYVIEDPDTDEVTDFMSWYSLPSSVLKHETHKTLNIAYSYYYFTDKYSVGDLMKNCLILAKNKGYDVFNALDIMHNSTFVEELKFGIGDGNLHYYLYNWRVNKIEPKDVGVVLV